MIVLPGAFLLFYQLFKRGDFTGKNGKIIPMSENLENTKEKKHIDIHCTKSDKNGFLGFMESRFRRFKTPAYMFFYLLVVFICLVCVSVSLFPLTVLVIYCLKAEFSSIYIQALTLSFSLGLGFFLFVISLLVSTSFFNKINPFEIKPWKGNWYSLEGIPWFYHNALFYLVRYSVLDFITPSPIAQWYLRSMGMKIGKNVVLNTSNISDPCLLVLEDYVTIGGSVTLMGHYGQKGILILSPTIIKKGSMVGLRASIFGGVTVEEGSFIPAHEAVLPKTVVTKESFLKA